MGIYAWGNTNVVGKRVEARSGSGLYVDVANRYKALEKKEETRNRYFLMLCDRAREGCRAAARILARHGIRQYTQEEIDASNHIRGEEISENKNTRQTTTV